MCRFPNGVNTPTYTTQTGASSAYTSAVAKPGLIATYLNANDRLYFTNSGGNACNIQILPNTLYTGTTLATAMNNLFSTALAGNNCNLTVAFSTVSNLFTFSDNTTTNTFTLLSANSTCLAPIGISQVDHVSTPIYVSSTLISPQIIDLSGNNCFYFTTNLATGNYRKNTINK